MSVSGRWHSLCKGPGVGPCLACWMNSQEAPRDWSRVRDQGRRGGQGEDGTGPKGLVGLGEDLGFYPREEGALEGCGQRTARPAFVLTTSHPGGLPHPPGQSPCSRSQPPTPPTPALITQAWQQSCPVLPPTLAAMGASQRLGSERREAVGHRSIAGVRGAYFPFLVGWDL